MTEFEISVHDIDPPLARHNPEFAEEQKNKRLQTSGEVMERNIYFFPDDEGDDIDEAPSIEVLSFRNGDRIMIFGLRGPYAMCLYMTMPIDGEKDLRPQDLLFTIKEYVEHTDVSAIFEEMLVTGKIREDVHPYKIN